MANKLTQIAVQTTDFAAGFLAAAEDQQSALSYLGAGTGTGAVDSVNGQTGVVTLDAADVGALASGDNISELTNDAGYLTEADIPGAPVLSVQGQTGNVVLKSPRSPSSMARL